MSDSDDDGKEKGADYGGPHGVVGDAGGVGGACECSESLLETGDLLPSVD